MEQFVDFTYMKDIDLGRKADMSYRFRRLLEECIELSAYGDKVKSIHFSPMIGSVLNPNSRYVAKQGRLALEFDIDLEVAVNTTESEFFYAMLEAFIQAVEAAPLPEDFDVAAFKADLKRLRFEQLQQAA